MFKFEEVSEVDEKLDNEADYSFLRGVNFGNKLDLFVLTFLLGISSKVCMKVHTTLINHESALILTFNHMNNC